MTKNTALGIGGGVRFDGESARALLELVRAWRGPAAESDR